MSAADVTIGFFGKIPATGDFVSRGLAGEFVRAWDPWISTHLVPMQTAGIWANGTSLRFLLGPAAMGPMAGVILPSADRIGRRFPLTLAAPLVPAPPGLLIEAGDWFAGLETAARAACEGAIGADDLAAELAAYPFPTTPAGVPVQHMVFSVPGSAPAEVDRAAPRAALERLVMAASEVL